MKKNLEEKLQKDFPQFFRDLYGDYKQTCLAFGIECGDGWFDLVYKLCENIKKINPLEEFTFAQIKEKWGSIRIYANYPTIEILDLIDIVEKESEQTCENCGSLENVTTSGPGWIKTLCENCRGHKV